MLENALSPEEIMTRPIHNCELIFLNAGCNMAVYLFRACIVVVSIIEGLYVPKIVITKYNQQIRKTSVYWIEHILHLVMSQCLTKWVHTIPLKRSVLLIF